MKLSKRVLSIVLALFVCFGCLPVISIAADDDTISHLTEVPDGYIGIYTKDDLMKIHHATSSNYILMNDIVFKYSDFDESYNDGNGWIPFPEFKGVFDGNGYKISNIRISGEQSDVGLFSAVRSTAIVKNLFLENINIDVTGSYVGGITGRITQGDARNEYNYTIDNCRVSGKISGNQRVGGICGYVGVSACYIISSVAGCCNAASINGYSGVGGVVGYLFCGSKYSGYTGSDGSSGKIYACVNTGEISGDNSVGGILGYAKGTYSSGTYGGDRKSVV